MDNDIMTKNFDPLWDETPVDITAEADKYVALSCPTTIKMSLNNSLV